MVVTLLTFIDSSTLYHAIRGQSTLKLYVIYNFLEIVDKLVSALGHDTVRTVLLSFSSQENHGVIASGFSLIAACFLVLLHATLLFVQTMVLNVTVNSQSSALIALLVSNNSIELKGAVFKRFDAENALQVTCADACERCQLMLILFVVTVHNISTTDGLPSITALLEHPQTLWLCATAFFIVWATECAIDWTKHTFVSKFNCIPVSSHKQFLALFCADVNSFDHGSEAPFLTQRLGYLPLSISAVVVRVIFARVIQPSPHPFSSAAFWYTSSFVLFLLLGGIMRFIASSLQQAYVCIHLPFLPSFCCFDICCFIIVFTMCVRICEQTEQEMSNIYERFGKVSRWTMCKGRIPG